MRLWKSLIGLTVSVSLIPWSVQAAPQAHILAVGDVMLGRYVETLMRTRGEAYPFAELSAWLQAPSYTMANLEGPIDSTHSQTANGAMVFSFLPSVAQVLANHGIDYVSQANNHAYDQGQVGYDDSRQYLTDAGIAYSGNVEVYRTRVHSQQLSIITFTDVFNRADDAAVLDLITTQRSQYPADFIIVYPHWGNEYQTTASTTQQQLAHALIDAGADAIIGHHPHVVQNTEIYQGKFIAYSLGNFIFDQYFSEDTQQGLAVHIVLDSQKVVYVLEELQSDQSQPRVVGETERIQLLR